MHGKSILEVEEKIQKTTNKIIEIKNNLQETEEQRISLEKENAVLEQTLTRERKLKEEIINLDICPLCKNHITKEHIKNVTERADNLIKKSLEKLEKNKQEKLNLLEKKNQLQITLGKSENLLKEIEKELSLINNIDDKKERLKIIYEEKNDLQKEMQEIGEKLLSFEKKFENLKNTEENYDETRIKIQELSFVDIDIDSETSMKKRDIEKIRIELKNIVADNIESEQELKQILANIEISKKKVEIKDRKEKELYEKFQKLYEKRNEIQDTQKAIETEVIGLEHESRIHEQKINEFHIDKAQKKAQQETIENEFEKFHDVEILKLPLETLAERLQKSQFKIQNIGTINMKALEVYEQVKISCESIQERVETLEKEKEQILLIITQIDKKKKKAFMITLEAINELFTRNFTQLSKKGEVFLELENKQNIFEGGLNILLKVGRGKYFDVSSLSGGEKTLVALSLIFAIQEYKPYYFYIFDEIDAALDKHNSELLAALIKKHMTAGQYIVISHNDALISEAKALYGVSMQENISKVVSLRNEE